MKYNKRKARKAVGDAIWKAIRADVAPEDTRAENGFYFVVYYRRKNGKQGEL